ncbi:MAG TPA: LLM class flavin-dependent oxidoreductase [Candidatus Cybelea sp.]|nr:LLM class flavin-dependent oxidoreductase [Candidatus Cybelea sp.]
MPRHSIALSVLDQSPIRSGATPADAVRETIELARIADRLGYRRYWLAEHHSSAGLAGTTPEVLIARVAAETRHMRIGSGGVMLPHYSALKVAENFRMLETLYPGRIDLGIGRAPGSDQRTARALQHGPGALGIEEFPNQLADLAGFLRNDLEAGHPFAGIEAMPTGPTVPEIWMLGSSDQSAAYAAHFGFAFSFAQFIAGVSGAQVVDAYRRYFTPSAWSKEPRASVGISVVTADTEDEARRLAKSRNLWLVRLATGHTGPFPSPEEADAYPYTDRERAFIRASAGRSVVGDVAQVKARLTEMAEEYGVDELVIVTICHDFRARVHSYELLAAAFDLPAR